MLDLLLDLLALGRRELAKIGLAREDECIDGCVVRQKKAYPVYDDGYKRTYRGAKPATELRDQIKAMGLEPRESQKFGDFYVLPAVFRPDSDDDPF